jgi:hypothetical protein
MTTPDFTLEEVKQILSESYMDMLGKDSEDIDIYNIQQVGDRSYTYDASVYYRADTEEQESIDFKNQIETEMETFKSNLMNRVRDKVKIKKPSVLDTYLNTSILLSLDNTSGRHIRAFNKGKSRPKFDEIVPTILPDGSLPASIQDFIQIDDVSVSRLSDHVQFSFSINTDRIGLKIYWKAKLLHDPVLPLDSDWLKSTDPNQKNGVIQSFTTPPTLSHTLSHAYSGSSLLPVLSLSGPLHLHLVAFFDSDPSYAVFSSVSF